VAPNAAFALYLFGLGGCVVLQEGAVLKLAKLVPNRPTVKHNMTSSEKDALMRVDAEQMVRLPPSFFRLATQLCRLAEGQRDTQSSGLLKRVVERMTMGDGQPHDVAVRTECALLCARMANKFSNEFGSSTDLLLTTKFRLVPTLCAMLHPNEAKRTRFAAAAALRALCEDVARGAPAVAAATGPAGELMASVHLVSVLRESPLVAHPLLREALEAVRLMAASPGGALDAELLKVGAKEALLRVAADITLENPYRGTGIDRITLGDAARDALSELTDASGKPVVGTQPRLQPAPSPLAADSDSGEVGASSETGGGRRSNKATPGNMVSQGNHPAPRVEFLAICVHSCCPNVFRLYI
jgi:hypothetical protein